MRTETLDYVGALNLGAFGLSQELPWEESGIPLYQKNLKRIYIDVAQTTTDPLIATFSGLLFNNELNIVRMYFSCDAKQVPANYDTLVTDLKTAKDNTAITGAHRREAFVSTEIINDLLVTTVELRFTKLLT